MAAAQIFQAAVAAEPAIPDGIARGDFAPLLGWLRANVHGHGLATVRPRAADRSHRPAARPEAFKAHLQRRYLSN